MIPGVKETVQSEEIRSLRCRDKRLLFGRIPLVMGVLNITPDSFSDGGRYFEREAACAHAFRLVEEGADIIDIGGESTRPGSIAVGAETELERITPILEAVIGEVPAPVSVDTRKAEVAKAALEMGCHLINDVSACQDPEMPEVLRRYQAPVIIMHMKDDPRTMQVNPTYEDVVREVAGFLRDRAGYLEDQGIPRDHIVIDPGIGFGKRFRDNLELLKNIDALRTLGYPVLIGASRKRFLGELLRAAPDDRVSGSLAAAARCWIKGVEIIRCHDVKETVGLLRVLDALEHPHAYSADW